MYNKGIAEGAIEVMNENRHNNKGDYKTKGLCQANQCFIYLPDEIHRHHKVECYYYTRIHLLLLNSRESYNRIHAYSNIIIYVV